MAAQPEKQTQNPATNTYDGLPQHQSQNHRFGKYQLEASFTAEIKSIIESQINKMPEPMRQIFLYNRFEGKTYQEIAEITGINVRNVTANIQRALAIMRIALNDYLIILIIVLYSSVIR